METLIIVGIIIAFIWYRITECPHGIHNGDGCQACAEARENRRQEEERQREMIRQAAIKRQNEEARLKEEIEQGKKVWLEETRKLEFLLQMDPRRFQELMWILFRKLGWEIRETPFSQDGGADGLLVKGSSLTVLQCKRYRHDIGEPTIRDLYGTYSHLQAKGAILVTTGRISAAARKFAAGKTIELYDGDSLLTLLKTANMTAEIIPDKFVVKHDKLLPIYENKAKKKQSQLKKFQNDSKKSKCPHCQTGTLEVRNGYRGLFTGCSNYPRCNYTHNGIRK